jgi:hypothetical protein
MILIVNHYLFSMCQIDNLELTQSRRSYEMVLSSGNNINFSCSIGHLKLTLYRCCETVLSSGNNINFSGAIGHLKLAMYTQMLRNRLSSRQKYELLCLKTDQSVSVRNSLNCSIACSISSTHLGTLIRIVFATERLICYFYSS